MQTVGLSPCHQVAFSLDAYEDLLQPFSLLITTEALEEEIVTVRSSVIPAVESLRRSGFLKFLIFCEGLKYGSCPSICLHF